jgi:hypothetical protein
MVAPTKARNPTATSTGITEDCWRGSPKIAIPANIAPKGGTAESATQCAVLKRDQIAFHQDHA